MAEIYKERERTTSGKGSTQETTTGATTSTQSKSTGARTDTTPVHQGIEVTFRLAIYQPRLGASGGTLECL